MVRLLAFVPTRQAALVLFAVALCVFWFQALGWPMAKGRDTWDYLVYYLQFFDSNPPLSQVQLFRAAADAARRRAADGDRRERPARDRLRRALRRLAWLRGARRRSPSGVSRRSPRRCSSSSIPPGRRSTTRRRATPSSPRASRCGRSSLARTLRRPSTRRVRRPRRSASRSLVLIRPANQVLLPAVVAPLLAAAPWRRRLTWVAVCLAAAVLPLAGWAVAQRDPLRRLHRHARRPRLGAVPARVARRQDDRAGERRRSRGDSRGLIEQHVLTEEPFSEPPRAARRVPRERLELRDRAAHRALRPRTSGRDDNYERDLRLRDRGDPQRIRGRTSRGVADVFWEFLMQAPIREGIAPRAQTAPEPPPADVRRATASCCPNPPATVLARCRALRVRLVRVRLHRLVHARRPVASSGTTLRRSGATARSSRRCGRGMPSCRRAPASSG